MPTLEMAPSEGAEDLKELSDLGANAPMSAATGIASIALSMAMKYCNMNTVQEGALYQQYKLEGRNIGPCTLEWVFHIADQIEQRLLFAQNRMSMMALEQAYDDVAEVLSSEEEPDSPSEASAGNPATDEPLPNSGTKP